MTRIRILPDIVANQIAAGEVIERPASVLKELVENAIDAHASSIRVEIRGGGKSVIRVGDDGHGMGRDDALLCLERHATSKIHESADIGAIHTLGFRGEAIPSIAAVSRFRLLSREADAPAGVEVDVHGGKILAVKEAGCAPGTQVEVRNLFFNLPARRKFLRSDATELGHLHHVFLLHAIAQPQIAWTLHQEDRLIHQLASEKAGDPTAALLNRVRALHGPQLAAQLLPVELSREGIRIRGLIGKPGLSRSNRSELYCYVNARPVDSRAIYYGLVEGYHTSLMRGRYPVCFLFLDVDPASVDVNIHPAKREVRFREDARVQGAVIEAVRRALGTEAKAQAARAAPVELRIQGVAAGSQEPGVRSQNPEGVGARALQTTMLPSPVPANVQHLTSNIEHPTPIPSTQPPEPSGLGTQASGLRILGVVARLFVVAMDEEGLVIVDQHAAHERVLFEQVMERMARGTASSQRLLLPQTVELSPRDAAEMRGRLPMLEKMGFGVAEFGERSFIVDAVPPFVKVGAIAQLMRAILDELGEAGRGINRDRFAEETVAKTVCRHSVKANDTLRPEELERLLADLRACAHPLTCPHGRPTMLRLSLAELERKFGRRQ